MRQNSPGSPQIEKTCKKHTALGPRRRTVRRWSLNGGSRWLGALRTPRGGLAPRIEANRHDPGAGRTHVIVRTYLDRFLVEDGRTVGTLAPRGRGSDVGRRLSTRGEAHCAASPRQSESRWGPRALDRAPGSQSVTRRGVYRSQQGVRVEPPSPAKRARARPVRCGHQGERGQSADVTGKGRAGGCPSPRADQAFKRGRPHDGGVRCSGENPGWNGVPDSSRPDAWAPPGSVELPQPSGSFPLPAMR